PALVRAAATKTTDATSAPVIENSYMLPQGARSTASVLLSTPAARSNVARPVTDSPIRPIRAALSSAAESGSDVGGASGADATGPPAGAAATGRRVSPRSRDLTANSAP